MTVFISKIQEECYNARVSYPCNDCCCEYSELCNHIIEIEWEKEE